MFSSNTGGGKPFSVKGRLDIFNILRGLYKNINLKIRLVYCVNYSFAKVC